MKERFEIRRWVGFKAPPRKVWRAFTDPKITPKYYYQMILRTNLKKGGEFTYGSKVKGKFVERIRGKILQIRPGKQLVTTFAFVSRPQDKVSRVTYTLSRWKNNTALVFVHNAFGGPTRTYRWVSQGWDGIFSGLKTLLETGKPLGV